MYISSTEKMRVIKKITAALRKQFEGMSAYSYGYCCNIDYDAFHPDANFDDYIGFKLYKGGANNDYHNGWQIGNKVYISWNVTKYDIFDVIQAMSGVISQEVKGYRAFIGYTALPDNTPDIGDCLVLTFEEEQE